MSSYIECTNNAKRFQGLFDQRSRMPLSISHSSLDHSGHDRIETWKEVIFEACRLQFMYVLDILYFGVICHPAWVASQRARLHRGGTQFGFQEEEVHQSACKSVMISSFV